MAPIQSDVAITDSATSIIGSADTAAASTGTTAAVTPTPTLEQNIFFTSHNDYRARHPIDAVQWSTDIAAQAAQYASQCQFQHSGTPGVGENLYAETVRSDGVDGAAQRAADAWYSEISSVNLSF
jgi:uncharacterized protein YkwD